MEAVVNFRPLVYVSDDVNQSHVLTPGDSLSMSINHIIPDSGCGDKDDHDVEPLYAKLPTTYRYLETETRNLNGFGCTCHVKMTS